MRASARRGATDFLRSFRGQRALVSESSHGGSASCANGLSVSAGFVAQPIAADGGQRCHRTATRSAPQDQAPRTFEATVFAHRHTNLSANAKRVTAKARLPRQAMTRTLTVYLELLKIDVVPLAAALGLERTFPAERRQPLRGILFNVLCFLGIVPILLVVVPRLVGPTGALGTIADRSLFQASLIEGLVGDIVAGLLVVLAWDFFQYWAHRAMHAVPVLWEIHKPHHSDTAVNASTAFRNHLIAHLFQCLAVSTPLALLAPMSVLHVGVTIVFFHLYGLFNHMNVRLSLGVLTPVLSGPQLHRIHHSSLQRHYDKNFAAFFPIFDILFGTYHRPAPDEFPPTGLGDADDHDIRAMTIGPLVGWIRQAGETRLARWPARAATAAEKTLV